MLATPPNECAPDALPVARDGIVRRVAAALVTGADAAHGAQRVFSVALGSGAVIADALTAAAASGLPGHRLALFAADERAPRLPGVWANCRLRRVPAQQRAPAEAARRYEQALTSHFRLDAGQLPRFDLVVLELEPDLSLGAMTSAAPAARDAARLVVAYFDGRRARIGLSLPVLAAARRIVLVASGSEVRNALAVARQMPVPPTPAPASVLLRMAPQTQILADAAARSDDPPPGSATHQPQSE